MWRCRMLRPYAGYRDVINEYANQWDIKTQICLVRVLYHKSARFLYTELLSLAHLPSTEC
jgi:hypothetical protein